MAEALSAQFSVLSLGLDFAPPFMLNYTESGRGLVATRDIAVGEIIMVERPVVWGPKASDDTCCHNCGRVLKELRKGQSCSECDQPFCGESCKNSLLHNQECQEMAKLNFDNLEKISHLTLIIVPLRGILLNKTSKIDYARMQLLNNHQNYLEETQFDEYNKLFLLDFIRTIGIGKSQASDEEIIKVCGVLNSNAYESKTLNCERRGLWPLTSMANSSCLPNTTHVFNKQNKLILVASKMIKKGEEIFVCYTGTRWGRSARQSHLRLTKNFVCGCLRCGDATDAGTFVSSVLCPACGGRVLENLTHSRNDEVEDWKCQKCDQSLPVKRVRFIEGMAGQLLKMVSKENPQHLERLVAKLVKSLSPTHYILIEIYMNLITLYQTQSRHIERLLDLIDFVEPVVEQLEGRSRALAFLKFAKIDAKLKLAEENTKDYMECVKQCRDDHKQIKNLLDSDVAAPENYRQVTEALGIKKNQDDDSVESDNEATLRTSNLAAG